jgi:hypothetical protein
MLAGSSQIVAIVAQSALTPSDVPSLQKKIAEIAQSSFLGEQDLRPLIVEGWETAAGRALEDDVLSQEEESSLLAFAQSLSLSQEELDRAGVYSRVMKAAVIRDVLEGKIPQHIEAQENLPFNLQKGETLVWVFPDTTYREVQTRTSYRGGIRVLAFVSPKGSTTDSVGSGDTPSAQKRQSILAKVCLASPTNTSTSMGRVSPFGWRMTRLSRSRLTRMG